MRAHKVLNFKFKHKMPFIRGRYVRIIRTAKYRTKWKRNLYIQWFGAVMGFILVTHSQLLYDAVINHV